MLPAINISLVPVSNPVKKAAGSSPVSGGFERSPCSSVGRAGPSYPFLLPFFCFFCTSVSGAVRVRWCAGALGRCTPARVGVYHVHSCWARLVALLGHLTWKENPYPSDSSEGPPTVCDPTVCDPTVLIRLMCHDTHRRKGKKSPSHRISHRRNLPLDRKDGTTHRRRIANAPATIERSRRRPTRPSSDFTELPFISLLLGLAASADVAVRIFDETTKKDPIEPNVDDQAVIPLRFVVVEDGLGE